MIIGELAVECGELQNDGEPGIEDMSVDIDERWRDSCFLILSCRISASILRSASSSFSRWVSTRSCSRSSSPILISSSRRTPRSMATLYLDSRSSRDEVVVRAWRSKSSLATSMSRSRSCSVLLVSRRFVISFSSVPWAVFASVLDSLYFLCGDECVSVTPPPTRCPDHPADKTYLPLLHLKSQALGLLAQRALALVGGIEVLLEFCL